jgi:hypothetical protein
LDAANKIKWFAPITLSVGAEVSIYVLATKGMITAFAFHPFRRRGSRRS